MADKYVTSEYLNRQFTNYSTKILDIFRKKNESYSKTESYSKEEVNNLIAAIETMDREVVSELPTTNISNSTIYFVPNDTTGTDDSYSEYIYVNGAFEKIGSTNLEGYVTEDSINTTLNSYIKKTDVETTDINFAGYFAEES